MNLKSRIPRMLNGNRCNAKSGKIIERKAKSATQLARRSKNSKVTEHGAIALKAHPGTVQEVECEKVDNGDTSYELDIVNDKGVETKVK
ncbi:MAG: hypothetical protein WC856_07395 [Methylococcaceae bacterium]|jgi:uncharacterized membrane protein YkoI